MLPVFSLFSSYDFAKSQEPDSKYGMAMAFLEAQTADGEVKPFRPFDIRTGTAHDTVAWWVALVHRIRCEGRRILVPLLRGEILQDPVSARMLHWLFTTPPTAKQYRERVAPHRKILLAGETRRWAMIRRLVLEALWGKHVLKHVPAEWHAEILARSAALQQQEADCFKRDEGLPTRCFRIPAQADLKEIAAVCHFIAGIYRKEGEVGTEPYVYANRWNNGAVRIADAFFAYALEQAGQTWRDKAIVGETIRQREKALQAELVRRFDALTAGLCDLLARDSNPDHLLARMNSFWPENLFNDYRAAIEHLAGSDT